MKGTRKETEDKYFRLFIDLKSEIQVNKLFVLTRFLEKNRVSTRVATSLIRLGVIKIHGRGYDKTYEWNDKIPVTMVLVKKIIKDCNTMQKSYGIKNNTKTIKKTTLPKVDKNKIERFNKVVKQEPTIKAVPTQQIGLIRKFLRWIY